MENESVGCDSCPAMTRRPELPDPRQLSVEFSTPYQENDPLTKGRCPIWQRLLRSRPCLSKIPDAWSTSTCLSSALAFPESARLITSRRNVRPRPTRYWTAKARSGEPGTCSATRVSVPIPTCIRSATRFVPGADKKAIADGASIRQYIVETAQEYGIDRKIRFGHQVTQASWSSQDAAWTVDATGPDGSTVRFACNFLCMCSGYYDYAEGYMPGWPGMDRYQGRIVHPQHWPEDLDHEGKRIVVIGSGATAVTLVPAWQRRPHT